MCVRKGEKSASSCTLSVLAKNVFCPKTVQTNTIKNSGFSGNCLKPKMTPFFENGFLIWVKKWVLLTVFLKSCVFWKHYLYSVFKNTAVAIKTVCRKNNENGGLFLNMAKRCFFVWFFQVLMVLCFSCVWLSMLVMFSQFWVLWGGGRLLLDYLGLEGLGVFVVLVFVFLLFRFCFCLFWLYFCFVVGLLLVLFLFCFSFFLFLFFLFCFLEGLRVRWGGPKGHLTWSLCFLCFSLLSFLWFN